MDSPSELDRFLAGQSSDGQVDSEGRFTIARDQALKKLAAFQLPFAAAWAVKVVQCAVASGTEAPIRVDLTVREARFYFVSQALDLDSVRDSFYDPEPQENRALNHLLNALWVVGLRERWAFQLALPGEDESLIWDGERLQTVETEARHSCVYLAVNLLSRESRLGWLKAAVQSGSRNAELLTALCKWCYTCPVPLTVDGRRIDSLFHCPTHGVNSSTFPLTCGFPVGVLEPLKIPRGTFEETSLLKDTESGRATTTVTFKGHSLRRASDKSRRRLANIEEASAPYVVATHWGWSVERDKGDLVPRHERSRLHWVADGVVVDQEFLAGTATHCSVAVFIDATGLETDLTSFKLVLSNERGELREVARTLVLDDLQKNTESESTLGDIAAGVQAKAYLLAGGLFVVGALTILGSPVHGVGLMVGSVVAGVSGKSSAKKQVERLSASLDDLRIALRSDRDI